jgi:hypothetical protein
MVINIVKYVAIAVLFGGVFTRSETGLALILQFAVVAAAVVVLTQAATLHRYVGMTLFVLLACLFNPLFPIPFSNKGFWAASIIAAFCFMWSVRALKTKPQLSIASITDLLPASEAL